MAPSVADRAEIGVADREIVADRPAEAGEADADRVQRRAGFVHQLDGEPAFLDAQADAIGAVMAGDGEDVRFEQVEDGDSPLLLDIGVAAEDRALVELDVDDPRVGHARLLAGAASIIHISSTGLLA